MYTTINFKTKRALKLAIAEGKRLTVFQAGSFGGNEPTDGRVTLEGPHYPAPHSWYADAILADGILVKVK